MAIQIEFKNTYSGAPAYAAGNFDDGEMLGTSYPISMRENGGTASSWLWSIVSAPRGSTAAILTPTAQVATFNPDMSGTWLIKCVIDGGSETEQRYMAVSPFNSSGRMAGLSEDKEDPTYGWSEGYNDLLRSLDEGKQKIFAGEALSFGDVVAHATYSGTLNQPRMWKIGSITTGTIYMRKPIGMVLDTSLATEDRGEVVTKGLHNYPTNTLTGYAIGKTVFADPSTSTLTMTTTEYPVGIIVRVGGSVGSSTIGAIYFDFSGLGLKLEEQFVPIEWCEDGPSAPAMTEVLTSGNGSLRIRKFDPTTEEDVIFPWEIPSSMVTVEGLMVSVVGYISEATATSGTGVSFEFERYQITDNGALNGTFSDAVNSEYVSLSHAQYDRFMTTEAILSLETGGILPGNTLMIKVARDVADADDDYADDIAVYGFRLRWVARK